MLPGSPATAFTPVPSVDAGLLLLTRRAEPLIPHARRRAYQEWVAGVFSSRGRGLTEVLRRNGVPAHIAADLARAVGRNRMPLPRDLR